MGLSPCVPRRSPFRKRPIGELLAGLSVVDVVVQVGSWARIDASK
jgi:hypothetical protein